MADTVGKLAEEIITQYYKKSKSDNSNYTLRHVAEQVATEIAVQAWQSAIEQDKLGESVFANDQFITSFYGIALQTDTDGAKYALMPNTPAGLPMQREVAYVGFTGNSTTQVFPIRSKDRFMQGMTKTPKWMVLYYIDGQKIKFDNLPALIAGPVDMKLVGAMQTGPELVNLPINAPKNVQSAIFDKILNRMLQVRNVLPDNSNDNISR